MTPENPPAFPNQNLFADPDHDAVTAQIRSSHGMTLRDYFAAKALVTLTAEWSDEPEQIAQRAYEIADQMLAARQQKEGK